jgi:hypothetical protein
MAKKLAAHFRAVRQVEGEKNKDGGPVYERVHLRPGDDPSDLPTELRKDLEKQGLIVDEKRLTKDGMVRLPYGHPDREVSTTEPEVAESQSEPEKKQTAKKAS